MASLSAYVLLALRILMALALYGFLAWCFITLWRELRQQAQNQAKRKIPALVLTLQGGQEQVRFTAPEIVIGRHPNCEWVLPDETVSSRHARLVYHHDQWWLEDMGSRNGTFLSGEALSAPAVLTDQDTVRCGQVNFSLAVENTPAAEEAK
jgi:pSer/pThr/pTyr-binding forkhead associated (FHA) protein